MEWKGTHLWRSVVHGHRKAIQNGGADQADSSMHNKHHEVGLIAGSELE